MREPYATAADDKLFLTCGIKGVAFLVRTGIDSFSLRFIIKFKGIWSGILYAVLKTGRLKPFQMGKEYV